MNMNREQGPVIIVGAGPVGLGAALELARFGVRSVILEKHASTSWHPKTRNFNTRTTEIARGWGELTYKRLRNIDTPPGWKSPIRFLRTAVGEQVGEIESKGFEGPGPDVSPAEPVMTSQELIEQILLDAVHSTNLVDVRFSTEVVKLIAGGAAGDERAIVQVRSTTSGEEETLSGPALVAADGAGSFVRNALGLELEGSRDLRHLVNCYFRADIEPHLGERKGVLLFVSNETVAGVLQPLDAAGRWLCQVTVEPEDHSPEAFDMERAQRWIRAAVGIENLPVEVLSIGFWKLNATVAEHLVQGRVLLCGDAAHQFPPTGGLGVNTGLQGMHNAMWKLAHFVQGKADWSLVETYEAERRDVAQRVARQSLENSINVARIFASKDAAETGLSPKDVVRESRRYGNHLGIEFGAAYRSSAVVGDGTNPPEVPDDYSDYLPSATPGCRAPHLWLGKEKTRLSTLDLFGTGFTILAAHAADPGWREATSDVEKELGVIIDYYSIGSAGIEDAGHFAEAYGLDTDGLALIRPDGHVAWRRVGGPADREALRSTMEGVLGR